MRILLLHNHYKHAGGEDAVVQAESSLLQEAGHEVSIFTVNNDKIQGIVSKAKAAISAFYSFDSFSAVATLLRDLKPDIVHVHNFFPLLTPSVYDACKEYRVPVIQTLHNYRVICPNALLYRDGDICEECVGKRVPWPAVTNRCYRDSHLESLAATSVFAFHNLRRSWSNVDRYIALTDFQRAKMIEGGLPAAKIVVKPNFTHSKPSLAPVAREDFALFVGRLSPEKGIARLLTSYRDNGHVFRWKIVGDGPDMAEILDLVAALPNVEILGRLETEDVHSLMLRAKLLVFPSRWYEGLPMTIVEAYSNSLPVIAYDIGSLPDVIKQNETGKLIPLSKDAAMLESIQSGLTDENTAEWGRSARELYELRYSPARNLECLLAIYHEASNEQK